GRRRAGADVGSRGSADGGDGVQQAAHEEGADDRGARRGEDHGEEPEDDDGPQDALGPDHGGTVAPEAATVTPPFGSRRVNSPAGAGSGPGAGGPDPACGRPWRP